jgi:hypothetical protein
MRTRSTRRERGADVAPGFPRRDDRQNDPVSSARSHGISAPSRLLRLALLVGILVAGAAAPHDPSVDAAAHVGGDVYALDLLPSRGPALGGTRVTFHGRGFTTDMACQFGPHTILPTSVSPEGDMRDAALWAPRRRVHRRRDHHHDREGVAGDAATPGRRCRGCRGGCRGERAAGGHPEGRQVVRVRQGVGPSRRRAVARGFRGRRRGVGHRRAPPRGGLVSIRRRRGSASAPSRSCRRTRRRPRRCFDMGTIRATPACPGSRWYPGARPKSTESSRRDPGFRITSRARR